MSDDENMPSVDLLRNCQPFKNLEKIGKLLTANKEGGLADGDDEEDARNKVEIRKQLAKELGLNWD